MRRIGFAFAVLVLLVPAAALAYPAQEFSFQVKDVKPGGRFTIVYSSRTYDTSGGMPPALRESFVRLPRGAVIPKEFLTKRYQCDAGKLLRDLQSAPEQSVQFAKRVDKLSATIKRIRSRLDQGALRNAETCIRSRVGEGTAQLDARPVFDELIPAVFYIFVGKGTDRGAVASAQIIGMPDENSAVVKSLPTTARQTRVSLALNLFNEPTDGKYGYKLVLPAGPIGGVNISLTEVRAEAPGISLKKKKVTCIKRNRGRCVRTRVKKTSLFWFTTPKCPQSGKLSFLAFYGYDDPVPDITKRLEIPCPSFKT
jgi:hypothetical protein